MALQNVKVNEQKVIGVDYEPIKDSSNVITSGAVYEKTVLTSQPIQDPQAEWEPSSAQEYIDEKIAEIDASIRELEGATEVQIGGGTPTDPDIRIYIDTSTDESVEVYTKQQSDQMFSVVVDSNIDPSTSTLTYTASDGTTKNFKTGDEVRIPDAEADNGYTFYKLYALTTEEGVTTATWDKLGAGGSAPINPNETVNISLTQLGGNSADLIGATVTVTNTDTSQFFTYTWQGTIITMEIATGTNYTVSVETISGYLACDDQIFIAGYQTERNISFQYIAYGVYIEATDGSLYTSSQWSSAGKTVNAIVCLLTSHKFRLAPEVPSKPIHSNRDDYMTGYMTVYSSADAAKADFNGKKNTEDIIRFNQAKGTNTTAYAAPYCNAYTFPNGQNGYFLTCGEFWDLYLNKTAVSNCFTACGSSINGQFYTSSSFDSGIYFWTVRWLDGLTEYNGMNTSRPILIGAPYN